MNDDENDNFKTINIDYACYKYYLENSELSDAQKREFLDTLWSIIVGFVDLGFGVHPLQQSCESISVKERLPAPESGVVLDSIDQLPKTEFIKAAICSQNGRGMREES